MLHTISKECAMAPSHVTSLPLPLFFFSHSVLQAQKWLKLEELVGEGAQEEVEEPEGEDIAGPTGEQET